MPNVFDPAWDVEHDDPPFRWRRARLGRHTGARELGASLFDLPVGAATFPLHAHYANEELLIVLGGTPTLHMLSGSRRLEVGEVVSFPAGRAGAHRLDNDSDAAARVLFISTMRAPEINEMLEAGTFWLRDYAPGEEPRTDSLDVHLAPEA